MSPKYTKFINLTYLSIKCLICSLSTFAQFRFVSPLFQIWLATNVIWWLRILSKPKHINMIMTKKVISSKTHKLSRHKKDTIILKGLIFSTTSVVVQNMHHICFLFFPFFQKLCLYTSQFFKNMNMPHWI